MTTMTEVDIKTGKVEVFNKTDAALADLKKRFEKFPAPNTEENYSFVKEGIKELSGLRIDLDAVRKRIKEPYLTAGRVIDSEAKRITSVLVALEGPMKEAKKEVDDKEARQKAERIKRLNAKIDEIKAWAGRAKGQESSVVADLIEKVDAISTDDFYELTNEAGKAKNETLEALNEIYTDRLSFERAEAERKIAEQELAEANKMREAEERKQIIKDRINTLKMIPVDMIGAKHKAIEDKISKLKNHPPQPAAFAGEYENAMVIYNAVVGQLSTLSISAKTAEDIAEAEEAVEAAKLETKKAEQELLDSKSKEFTESMAKGQQKTNKAVAPLAEKMTEEYKPAVSLNDVLGAAAPKEISDSLNPVFIPKTRILTVDCGGEISAMNALIGEYETRLLMQDSESGVEYTLKVTIERLAIK